VRRPTGKSTGTLRIGYIGRLVEQKGVHILLHATRALPAELNIALTIHGDVNAYPRYAKELRRLAGDDARIAFCGAYAPNQAGAVLAQLDVLVVPSIWYENTPLV
jgi:glycosyltransferase involved in cell wall biosynthesis